MAAKMHSAELMVGLLALILKYTDLRIKLKGKNINIRAMSYVFYYILIDKRIMIT